MLGHQFERSNNSLVRLDIYKCWRRTGFKAALDHITKIRMDIFISLCRLMLKRDHWAGIVSEKLSYPFPLWLAPPPPPPPLPPPPRAAPTRPAPPSSNPHHPTHKSDLNAPLTLKQKCQKMKKVCKCHILIIHKPGSGNGTAPPPPPPPARHRPPRAQFI